MSGRRGVSELSVEVSEKWDKGLMRIAGSPLGQPSLSAASGILLSYIFCHSENNSTGLRGRVAHEGRKIVPNQGPWNRRDGQIWDRGIGGLGFFSVTAGSD